ncbi:MAG: hypothetical protein ACP5VR_08275 [Acidimicrobiales bacterium]
MHIYYVYLLFAQSAATGWTVPCVQLDLGRDRRSSCCYFAASAFPQLSRLAALAASRALSPACDG